MTTTRFAAPTVGLTTYLSTSLNGLADKTTDLGAEINNETNRCMFMDLELRLASVDVSASTNPCVPIYLIESVDGGSTYESSGEDGVSADADVPPSDKICCIFVPRLDTEAKAKVIVKSLIPIPPGRFKLMLRNMLGLAFGATLNTLAYRTYNLETV